MKVFFVSLLSLLSFSSIMQANDSTKVQSPFTASLELSVKYMWRGIEYGTAPTLFPMIGYGYKGFNAFAMGAYAVNGSHQEVDLGVSYTVNEFTVGVSDYYYPSAVGERTVTSNSAIATQDIGLKHTLHGTEAEFLYGFQFLPMFSVRIKTKKVSRCTQRMPRWATPTRSTTTIVCHFV